MLLHRNKMGIFYEYSQPRFRQPDNAEAMRWFRKAAEQGNIEAQVNLGGMCANGTGVKKDGAEALKWWLMAAKQGDEWAEAAVGNCYVSDMCGKQNPEEAVKWYRKAAEQGSESGAYYSRCTVMAEALSEITSKHICGVLGYQGQ
jgi:TPR repeat protein